MTLSEATDDQILQELKRRWDLIEDCEPGERIVLKRNSVIAHRVVSDAFMIKGDEFLVLLYPSQSISISMSESGEIVFR